MVASQSIEWPLTGVMGLLTFMDPMPNPIHETCAPPYLSHTPISSTYLTPLPISPHIIKRAGSTKKPLILIFTVTHTTLEGQHIATYRILQSKNQITYGILRRADKMQAICLPVKTTLSLPYFMAHIFL
jgi:hypothetical protein